MIQLIDSDQEERPIPKILSPIRSFEGGVRVIKAGADQVYCGVTIPKIKDFVLYRGPAHEVPTYDELGRIVKYAHNHGVEVAVTVNRPFMARVLEDPIRNHIRSCIDEGVDALIVGDLGVLSMFKDMKIDVPLYASTFMASMNSEAIDFLRKQGFSRIILERNVTIPEISKIVQSSKIEIEVFIHGGGCSNINSSCYLYHFSFPKRKHFALITQENISSPCTFHYEIYDLGGEQTRLGSVPIMDALQYCSLCKLPELMKTGVIGFKIEGRGNPIRYQESTTKAYRELIDLLAQGRIDSFQEKLETLKRDWIPMPLSIWSLREFLCKQKRCYYSPLIHAPYRIPLSWQASTKARFKAWIPSWMADKMRMGGRMIK